MNRSTPGLPVHHQLPEFTRLTSIESVMPSSHLILCHPLLLLPPMPPSIRVFPMSQLFTSGGQTTPLCPAPHPGAQPAHSPPGALESSRKTLGRPHRALQRLSSRTSCCDCLSCQGRATKATKAQPTEPPWASSCSRNLVSSPRKLWGRSECQPECREAPGGAEGRGRGRGGAGEGSPGRRPPASGSSQSPGSGTHPPGELP